MDGTTYYAFGSRHGNNKKTWLILHPTGNRLGSRQQPWLLVMPSYYNSTACKDHELGPQVASASIPAQAPTIPAPHHLDMWAEGEGRRERRPVGCGCGWAMGRVWNQAMTLACRPGRRPRKAGKLFQGLPRVLGGLAGLAGPDVVVWNRHEWLQPSSSLQAGVSLASNLTAEQRHGWGRLRMLLCFGGGPRFPVGNGQTCRTLEEALRGKGLAWRPRVADVTVVAARRRFGQVIKVPDGLCHFYEGGPSDF